MSTQQNNLKVYWTCSILTTFSLIPQRQPTACHTYYPISKNVHHNLRISGLITTWKPRILITHLSHSTETYVPHVHLHGNTSQAPRSAPGYIYLHSSFLLTTQKPLVLSYSCQREERPSVSSIPFDHLYQCTKSYWFHPKSSKEEMPGPGSTLYFFIEHFHIFLMDTFNQSLPKAVNLF